jgi:hypothetical protein
MEMAASISKQHKLYFSAVKYPIYFTPVAWLELHGTEPKRQSGISTLTAKCSAHCCVTDSRSIVYSQRKTLASK